MKRFIKKFNEACLALDNSLPFTAWNCKGVEKTYPTLNNATERYDAEVFLFEGEMLFQVWECHPGKFRTALILGVSYHNGRYDFDATADCNLTEAQRLEKHELLSQFGITDDIQ